MTKFFTECETGIHTAIRHRIYVKDKHHGTPIPCQGWDMLTTCYAELTLIDIFQKVDVE